MIPHPPLPGFAALWFLGCASIIWAPVRNGAACTGRAGGLRSPHRRPRAGAQTRAATGGLRQLLALVSAPRNGWGRASIPVPQTFRKVTLVLTRCFSMTEIFLDRVKNEKKNKLSKYSLAVSKLTPNPRLPCLHTLGRWNTTAQETEYYFIFFIWPTTTTFLPEIPTK